MGDGGLTGRGFPRSGRITDVGDGEEEGRRATTLRSAIDLQAADWIRRAQYDRGQPLPEGVGSVEQINAHALVRLAEVFHLAPPEVRAAHFSPTVLYFASHDTDTAETVYGDLIPLSTIAHPDAHRIDVDGDGEPVAVDGVEIDTAPHARLASRAQRVALACRDRRCTFPGCARPTTWSLNAHHVLPFSNGGPTVMKNLTLLCSEHHALAHRG